MGQLWVRLFVPNSRSGSGGSDYKCIAFVGSTPPPQHKYFSPEARYVGGNDKRKNTKCLS